MSIPFAPPTCPTDEALALFAAGGIDALARARLLGHLEECSDCMAAVLAANAQLEEERSGRGTWASRWWMGVAAAAVIAVTSVPLLVRQRDPMQRMVALAPASERVVESRLSGGFAWAPYRGPMRSADVRPNVAQLKLGGAAGEAIERMQREPGSESRHAAGVAMVLVKEPEKAAALLEASARATHDARAWSDLAAARYAAAMQTRAPLLPLALAAADEALREDAELPEALFNRALILERIGSTAAARGAWRRYLQVDATSRWAEEARRRMDGLAGSG